MWNLCILPCFCSCEMPVSGSFYSLCNPCLQRILEIPETLTRCLVRAARPVSGTEGVGRGHSLPAGPGLLRAVGAWPRHREHVLIPIAAVQRVVGGAVSAVPRKQKVSSSVGWRGGQLTDWFVDWSCWLTDRLVYRVMNKQLNREAFTSPAPLNTDTFGHFWGKGGDRLVKGGNLSCLCVNTFVYVGLWDWEVTRSKSLPFKETIALSKDWKYYLQFQKLAT